MTTGIMSDIIFYYNIFCLLALIVSARIADMRKMLGREEFESVLEE